mgnify:CR=1 FL=1
MATEPGGPTSGQTFAALLRRHRVAAALSQEALANRAGISTRAVSDLERGVKLRPYLATVRLLADALGLDAEQRAALAAAARRPLSIAQPSARPATGDQPTRSALAEQAADFEGVLAELISLLHKVALTQIAPHTLDNAMEHAEAIVKLASGRDFRNYALMRADCRLRRNNLSPALKIS